MEPVEDLLAERAYFADVDVGTLGPGGQFDISTDVADRRMEFNPSPLGEQAGAGLPSRGRRDVARVTAGKGEIGFFQTTVPGDLRAFPEACVNVLG